MISPCARVAVDSLGAPVGTCGALGDVSTTLPDGSELVTCDSCLPWAKQVVRDTHRYNCLLELLKSPDPNMWSHALAEAMAKMMHLEAWK